VKMCIFTAVFTRLYNWYSVLSCSLQYRKRHSSAPLTLVTAYGYGLLIIPCSCSLALSLSNVPRPMQRQQCARLGLRYMYICAQWCQLLFICHLLS